ncbi:leucine permease transcriptional regulator [Apiospora saccharicola]|uniref:Leucine permease transcriptional regulator n=1 Tax=Apiospora saccharicola TaxID=335842 RepID=A0ABR1TK87_9PEZI
MAAPNPFASVMPPANAPFGAPSQGPFNPFSGIETAPKAPSPAPNPFAAAAKPNPFGGAAAAPGTTTKPISAFGQALQSHPAQKPTGLAHGDPNGQANGKRKGGHEEQGRPKQQRMTPAQPANHIHPKDNRQAVSNGRSTPKGSGREDFANTIRAQLARDGVKAPTWPSDPGARSSRAAMDAFRQEHKAYREKARSSLVKADLVDEEGKQRRLDEALIFKGICEEMCPEWEKIIRITENDVKLAEKVDRNGDMIPCPTKMVTRLARSAAGIELPLPMDVRSPAALRRSLDYMIDQLIPSDDLLTTRHHFLWDRTRAIRKDFIPQGPAMNAEEVQDHIYCLETIARFHVTSLHLLSRPGFAAEDFSEQQEREQLSKTLMSLDQAYDSCATAGIKCENEAEFRGYYALFFATETGLKEKVQRWPGWLWESDSIRTAMCLVEAIENTTMLRGPLSPSAPADMAINVGSIFFTIVGSPQISYTMACFAEIHFSMVRQSMLQVIKGAYSRPRDGPRDLTPEFLRRKLYFDTEDEAVAFAELHGLHFEEDNDRRYLVLNPRQRMDEPRVPHSFSRGIVERKRSDRPLAEIIHKTVYETTGVDLAETSPDEDSLFVEEIPGSGETPQQPDEIVESETDSEASAPPMQPAPVSSPSPSSGLGTQTSQSNLGVSPGQSVFAQPSSTAPVPSLSTTTAQSSSSAANPFAHLFGASKPISPTPDETAKPKADKKVTFGDSTFLGPPDTQKSAPRIFASPNQDTTSGSNETPSIFANAKSAFSSAKQSEASDSVTGKSSSIPSIFGSSGPSTAGIGSPIFGTPSTSLGDASTPNSAPASIFSTMASLQPTSSEAPGENRQSLSANTSSPFPSGPAPATTIWTPSTVGPLVSTVSSSITPATLPPPAPVRKDPLGSFTEWFVLGDGGLMKDHLEEWAVAETLGGVWETWVAEENERIRKEEDERSWAEARAFRMYSLSVTYFYRWLDIFRKRRVKKRIRMEREKARIWNSPQSVAAREAEEEAAKQKRHEETLKLVRDRKALNKSRREKDFRESIQMQGEDVEQALLASGIFKGMRDEQAAAREAAADDDEPLTMLPSEMLRRTENRRREKHGLRPISRNSTTSSSAKLGSKTAKLLALANGRDTLSNPASSVRNSTFSSSFRSSVGFNTSRVLKTKKSRVKDPYWQYKVHGLVLMPDGKYAYQPEALEKFRKTTMLESEPSDSLASTPIDDTPRRSLFAVANDMGGSHNSSPSPAVSRVSSMKRKRPATVLPDEAEEDEDLAAYRSEASAAPSRKRAKSDDDSDADFLAQMSGLLQEVEDERKKLE